MLCCFGSPWPGLSGLVPAIHATCGGSRAASRVWITGTSPVMTPESSGEPAAHNSFLPNRTAAGSTLSHRRLFP